MKKTVIIFSLLIAVVAIGYAMFNLMKKENGKENAQDDSAEAGNEVEAESKEGSQTA